MRFDGTECPRCKGTDFREVDCGPDSYDDDIAWTDTICTACGLRHDGWEEKWYADIEERIEYEHNAQVERRAPSTFAPTPGSAPGGTNGI